MVRERYGIPDLEREEYRRLVVRVFDVLDARGVRQDWLARRVGYSQALLTEVKMGRRPPSPRFVLECCIALDLPFEALFYLPRDASPELKEAV